MEPDIQRPGGIEEVYWIFFPKNLSIPTFEELRELLP